MGAGYIWFVGYGVITAAFALLLPISGLWAPEELGNPDEDFWAEFTPNFILYICIFIGPATILVLLKLGQRDASWADELSLNEIGELPIEGEEDANGETTGLSATMGKACRIPWFRNLWCTIWIFPFFMLWSLWRQIIMHMTQVSIRLGTVTPKPVAYALGKKFVRNQSYERTPV